MKFVDETTIQVRSGKGGDGIAAFRREKNRPLGGPDGGDGGDGGSVWAYATENADTLLPLARTQTYSARDGEPGRGHNRHGKSGADIRVAIPVGTVIYRVDGTGETLLADLDADGKEALLARGGKGGYGNRHFVSAENQAPEEYTKGEPGEERTLRCELKLIADVGLLGFPNAGKSTLLARLSAARPKVAGYPFTTMQPQLGIVSNGGHELVMADIPGLIEGASEGAGLGHEFLRHVERCRLLLHLVDLCPMDGTYPVDHVHAIRRELARFSPVLAAKPQLLVGNKTDLTGAADSREMLADELGEPVLAISAVTGEGLRDLVHTLFARHAAARREDERKDEGGEEPETRRGTESR